MFRQDLVLVCIIALTFSAHLRKCLYFSNSVENYKKFYDIASDFGTCKIGDEKCLRKEMENAMTKLANGNKELGIPSIDPFIIDAITIERRPGPISLSQKYSKIFFYGIAATKIPKFGINLDECSIYFETETPNARLTSHFSYDGQLLVLPVNAEGDIEGSHEILRTINNVTCEKYTKYGAEYLRFVDVKVKIPWGEIKLKLKNIKADSRQLVEQMQQIFNDNSRELIGTVEPELLGVWGTSVTAVSNRFFSQVPLNEIFKD